MKKRNKFVSYLIYFLEGALLGVISLGVPGFSASTVAMIIGIYVLLVEAMANIFKDFKKSIMFLACVYIGYGFGSALAALGINELFTLFPLATTIIIMGFIFGAYPDTVSSLKGSFKCISGYIVFIIIVAALILYNFLATEGNQVEFPTNPDIWFLIRMMGIGLVTSATFIIPGVDFAIVFLSLGLYYPFSNMLANIFRFGSENYLANLAVTGEILGFYLIGYFTGVILLSKLVKFLIQKYKTQTLFANAAFLAAAPVIVIKNCVYDNPNYFFSIPQLIVGLILALIVCVLMIYAGYIHKKREKERLDNMLNQVDKNIDILIKEKQESLEKNEGTN